MVEGNTTPYGRGENAMLREAIEAIRLGDKLRARDLLTRLLKTGQNNPTYWVWLSSVVDTKKESLYCLQTALKLDPKNTDARRGLVLLGGLPPDDHVQPFSLKRVRKWEEELSIPVEDDEKPRGWTDSIKKLVWNLAIIVVAGSLLVVAYFLFAPGGIHLAISQTPTHHPTFTLSPTPSSTPASRTATPTFLGPTPLSFFLSEPYTPTPLYVVTEHPVLTKSLFDAGLRLLGKNQYENARVQFLEVLNSEPEAVDAWYFIGESYRFENNYENARDAYQEAININPSFAPAFLGRARANLALGSEANVKGDLDNAILLDPLFTEAYIQRADFQLSQERLSEAIADLEMALEINPSSAAAWMSLAQVQLASGDYETALSSALNANQLDLTLVPVYLTLAQAYFATGQAELAAAVLQTYTIYAENDRESRLIIGTIYNELGRYESAVEALNQYLDAFPRSAEALFQRGQAYLYLGNFNLARNDFEDAVSYDPFDFDAQLGIARADFNLGLPGDAYLQAEKKALPLASTDVTRAQAYYWIAIFLENFGDAQSEQGARNYWFKLIGLPAEAMPAEWRNTAFEHLNITPTFTPTPRPTRTPTATP